MHIRNIFALAAAVAVTEGVNGHLPAVPLKNALLGPVNRMVAEFQPGRGRDYHPRPYVRRNTVAGSSTVSSSSTTPTSSLTPQGQVEQRQKEDGLDSRAGGHREDGEDEPCEQSTGYYDVHEDL